jgi:hypothetical protein
VNAIGWIGLAFFAANVAAAIWSLRVGYARFTWPGPKLSRTASPKAFWSMFVGNAVFAVLGLALALQSFS